MNEFLLKDISLETELILSFILNDNVFEFPIKIQHKKDKNLFLEVIRINNKVLGFTNSNIPISLILNRKNEKPLIWERCKLKVVKDNNNNFYYEINGDIIGKEINRRKDFRVSIGLSVDVTIGTNRKVIKGVLKDLSASGFAIIIDKNKDINCPENEFIRISFDDLNLNYHINLMGKIVRLDTELTSDEKILYGCYFIKNYPNIGQYLNLKQREYLVRHSKNLPGNLKKILEDEKKTRKVII